MRDDNGAHLWSIFAGKGGGDRADQMHDLIPYAEGREQHEEDDQYFNKKSLALAAPHGREFKD